MTEDLRSFMCTRSGRNGMRPRGRRSNEPGGQEERMSSIDELPASLASLYELVGNVSMESRRQMIAMVTAEQ